MKTSIEPSAELMHAGRLAGKVAIVTGAARGMGAVIARRFVEEGAFVALTDVLPEVMDTAAALGPPLATCTMWQVRSAG